MFPSGNKSFLVFSNLISVRLLHEEVSVYPSFKGLAVSAHVHGGTFISCPDGFVRRTNLLGSFLFLAVSFHISIFWFLHNRVSHFQASESHEG